MIIEQSKEIRLLDKKADAVVIVVDSSGVDLMGYLRSWPDVHQIIQMKALCKELIPGMALHLEMESAHMFIVTNDDFGTSMDRVFQMAAELEIGSINVPDLDDLSFVIWGMETSSSILVRLCRP